MKKIILILLLFVFKQTIVLSENFTTNYGPYGPYGPGGGEFIIPKSREIVSWGKNDFGQTEFPIKYIIAGTIRNAPPTPIKAATKPTKIPKIIGVKALS